jgi:hypothetical protein
MAVSDAVPEATSQDQMTAFRRLATRFWRMLAFSEIGLSLF